MNHFLRYVGVIKYVSEYKAGCIIFITKIITIHRVLQKSFVLMKFWLKHTFKACTMHSVNQNKAVRPSHEECGCQKQSRWQSKRPACGHDCLNSPMCYCSSVIQLGYPSNCISTQLTFLSFCVCTSIALCAPELSILYLTELTNSNLFYFLKRANVGSLLLLKH